MFLFDVGAIIKENERLKFENEALRQISHLQEQHSEKLGSHTAQLERLQTDYNTLVQENQRLIAEHNDLRKQVLLFLFFQSKYFPVKTILSH